MELNLEEIEKVVTEVMEYRRKLELDDTFVPLDTEYYYWLIAEVKRLRDERDSLQSAEKEISDAYLRIREIVGAWDTNMGGENRYEVTENAVRTLKEENHRLQGGSE